MCMKHYTPSNMQAFHNCNVMIVVLLLEESCILTMEYSPDHS
jgi:hypothetical protein